jgi:PAS domain S-box-containing protein
MSAHVITVRRPIDAASMLAALATIVVYLAAVRVGVLLMLPDAPVSLLWPASGAALAAVWLFGRPALLGLPVAATLGHIFLGYPPIIASAVGLTVTVAAYLGRSLLARYQFASSMYRLRDVLILLVAGPGVTATLGSLAMAVAGLASGIGKSSHFAELWWLCWVAQVIGSLVVLPVLLGWSSDASCPSRRRRVEATGFLVLAGAIGWLVYSDVLPQGIAMARPLSYLIFPVMIAAAVRTSVRQTALILLVHAAIALTLTANGHGPFTSGTMEESLLALHAHIAMLSVSSLILAAIMTERQAVTRALADREAKYRLLVENQTDLVIKTDADDRIVFASPTVAELFGRSTDELIGSSFRSIVDDADRHALGSPWRSLFGEQGSCYLERPVQTRYGERWLGWAAKAVRTTDGPLDGVVVVGRDVTARRQAEAASREYFQELAHVGRLSAMGEMAAGLAHELNQPLCAITTYAQASRRLLDTESNPQLTQALDRVIANGERAGGIIQQMRAYVRKDAPERTAIDLNAAIHEVLALNDPELRQAGISVEQELTPGLPAVCGVEIQIHQVLVNLVRNAMEALRQVPAERRALMIRTQVGDDQVEVCIEDTGPGLDATVLDQLFEPFVSAKHDGLGLGLSITRSIINHHGGQLTGTNRDGHGARFVFTLPIDEISQQTA